MTENELRLKRAKEALEYCRDKEHSARRVLAACSESSRRAKERVEELFLKCENEEVKRRRALV